ncbi:MAG: ATP-binding protein [Myxococcota bacterium]
MRKILENTYSPAAPSLAQAASQAASMAAETAMAAARLASAATAMEVVARIATQVARELDVTAVVNAVLDASELLGARGSVVFAADEQRRELRLLGERGFPADFAERVRVLPFDTPAVTAVAATTRRPQLVLGQSEVHESYALARELLTRLSGEAILALPLVAHERLVGVYTYVLPESRPPTPDERWAAQTIAEIIAVGLANARAYSEERRLRRKVEVEHARLEAVLGHAPHAVLYLEAESERLHLNNRAREMLCTQGLAEVPLSNIPWRVLQHDGKPYPCKGCLLEHVMRQEDLLIEEHILERNDGRRIPVVARWSRVTCSQGRVVGAVGIVEDISTRKELERLREEWGSIVTHDMRQPLHLITMAFDMLGRTGTELPAVALRALQHGRNAATTLNRMVKDLSDVSRLESQRMTVSRENVDLAALVRDVAERMRLTSGRAIEQHVEGLIPPLQADPVRMDQVLTNLLSNAVKYSPAETPILLRATSHHGHAHIHVANAGPGIPPEDLPHLFERYYRTHRARTGRVAGLGLGLYITKGLVEAHGGRITVESLPGERTTFTVSLPLTLEDEVRRLARALESSLAGSNAPLQYVRG